MKSHKLFSVALVSLVLFVSLFSARTSHAILGDVNGDSTVSLQDIVCLNNHLFGNGCSIVRNNSDVDNCPGINLGDSYQLMACLFDGKQLFPPIGTDLVVPSGIKISTGWLKGESTGDTLYLPVKIKTTDDPDLCGLIIPLSYKHLSGQTELECIRVDTAGTIWEAGGFGYKIDDQNKKVLVSAVTGYDDPPIIDSDSEGMIFKLVFEVVTAGNPTQITGTYSPPENTMLLISKYAYESSDSPGRMLVPKFFLDYMGDVNCDGKVDMPDAVYLINYFLYGGPPPCDP